MTGTLVTSMAEATALQIPKVGEHRTAVFPEGIRLAKQIITDRPVFGGIIGPFSLVGRLVDVSEALVNCYEEPEMIHVLLEKAGIRQQVKIMIGGAPVTQKFCDDIGADAYTPDAASAAQVAYAFVTAE